MTPYRKITSNIIGKLSLQEAFLFYCLALNADCYTMKSHIKQESLANFYGIKKTDQIREYLYKFQSLGLLKIDKTDVHGQFGIFNRCIYTLDTAHYVLISNKLYDESISKELKGFLVQLKCLCLNGTNTTLYNQKRIAEEMNLSTGTVSKYIKEAAECRYIKKDEKGIHLLDKEMFIITAESELAFWKNFYPSIITDEDLARGYIV